MKVARYLSDSLRVRRPGRSRLDDDALQNLKLLDLTLRLVGSLTRRDRKLVAALLRERAVTLAAGRGSRSYASRRTHQVLLPKAELLAELARIYLDGNLDTFGDESQSIEL